MGQGPENKEDEVELTTKAREFFPGLFNRILSGAKCNCLLWKPALTTWDIHRYALSKTN